MRKLGRCERPTAHTCRVSRSLRRLLKARAPAAVPSTEPHALRQCRGQLRARAEDGHNVIHDAGKKVFFTYSAKLLVTFMPRTGKAKLYSPCVLIYDAGLRKV